MLKLLSCYFELLILSHYYTDLACKGSVTQATINGLAHPFFFITDLGPSAIVKLTKLPYNFTNAEGVEICLTLDMPCNNLGSMCLNGACRTSFFTSELHKNGSQSSYPWILFVAKMTDNSFSDHFDLCTKFTCQYYNCTFLCPQYCLR